ncbi:MAG TPA: type II toxin-antitoxin system HicB family antitoxin [Prolixibacteraceae bacterium]|jgi:predicted RNase H-like HicB family nuclease
MKTVNVVVEKTNTGYSAYIPDVVGIASVGDTFNELRENVQEALVLYLETSRQFGDSLPEILSEEYQLAFKFDIQTFMEWLPKVMSQKGLSDIAGMNESLISQYAHGVKNPGPKQLKRMETALHRFADDLHAISF